MSGAAVTVTGGVAAGVVVAAALAVVLLALGWSVRRVRRADRTRAFLENVIDRIGDPIFVKDREHRLVLVNDAECKLAGRPRRELIGMSDAELVSRERADGVRRQDEELFQTGRESTAEEVLRDAAGNERTILIKKTLSRTPDGATYIVGVLRDVTDRKRAEEELGQARRMESIGLLAGGIAHDFNNLLTPILGNAELVLLEEALPESVTQAARDIKAAAARASDLTRQLLAFGRKQMLELRTNDVKEVITRFEPILRRAIREDVRIEVLLPPSLGTVRADAGQLEQVLLNLAVNAQDAMPTGGLLTIQARDVEIDGAPAGQRSPERAGPYVLIAVSDTGCGMDHETRQRLFEPFFTTKERGKGTGLGLSTVYGIVRQHGGSISVHSEVGEGSRFEIYLPRAAETAPAPGDEVPAEEPSLDGRERGGETILIVEDNDMVRATASGMLQRLGYQVLAADSAEGAYRVVESHPGPIDLLLTDVVLSGSNGKEVFEKLKGERPKLKVVYMSGYTSDVIVHHGVLDAGIHLIQKPLSLTALSEKIRDVLDQTLPLHRR
jgi:PAS domain S-box-containing protein